MVFRCFNIIYHLFWQSKILIQIERYIWNNLINLDEVVLPLYFAHSLLLPLRSVPCFMGSRARTRAKFSFTSQFLSHNFFYLCRLLLYFFVLIYLQENVFFNLTSSFQRELSIFNLVQIYTYQQYGSAILRYSTYLTMKGLLDLWTELPVDGDKQAHIHTHTNTRLRRDHLRSHFGHWTQLSEYI